MLDNTLLRLFCVLLFAVELWASPVVQVRNPSITLPLARHFNATGVIPMAQRDAARIKALVQSAKGNIQPRNTYALEPAFANFYYTVEVRIAILCVLLKGQTFVHHRWGSEFLRIIVSDNKIVGFLCIYPRIGPRYACSRHW